MKWTTSLLILTALVISKPVTAMPPASEVLATTGANWQKLTSTIPYAGKQDDIMFLDAKSGWYVNGAGYIYATKDGGASWSEQIHQPGTYFRSVGFINEKEGFAGNIGPDYFPGVIDETPLYQTHDGGVSWKKIPGVSDQPLKGVCSIDVLDTHFINAGVSDHRVTIHAAGRVGGPAAMATSKDGGKTWASKDLSRIAGMILDVKFLTERVGFLCAASDSDVDSSHALILKTLDGGETWRTVYQSTRPAELIWKCAFPTHTVGYATVQSYAEDVNNVDRYVIKTVDGGEHWTELLLTKNHDVQEFGVGFADSETGWVGTRDGGWQTTDGGKNWVHIPIGHAVNKIRIVPEQNGGFVGYAIGVEVLKLDARIH